MTVPSTHRTFDRDLDPASSWFPAYYLELAESVLRARRADPALIQQATGLSARQVRQPDLMLDLDQFEALVRLMVSQLPSGEPRFLQLLRHLPITAHGMIGVAGMTADTLSDSLDTVLHFLPLVMPVVTAHREAVGRSAHVVMRCTHDFGPEINALLVEMVAGSFKRMAEFANAAGFGGGEVRLGAEMHFAHDTAQGVEAFAAFFGGPVRFGMPDTRMIIPHTVLARPLLTRNRTTHRLITTALERDLAAGTRVAPMTQKVRRLLAQGLAGGLLLDAAALARELAMSTRTLSRRLREEGSALPELTRDIRIEQAERLLAGTDLPLAKIARQLGFSELATFSRAFKQATGRTPGEFRRSFGDVADPRTAKKASFDELAASAKS